MVKRIILFSAVGLALLLGGSAAADEKDTPNPAASRGPERSPKPVDVRSQMIEVEVLITQMSSPDAEGDAQLGRFTPTDESVARVRELAKQGKLDVMNRFRLTTLDEQAAFVHLGERVPVVSGGSRHPGRPGPQFVSYMDVGTIVGVTPKVVDDAVVIELNIEKSRLVGGRPSDRGDDAESVLPPKIGTATCQTTVRVAKGATVIVGATQSEPDHGSSMFFALITARIVAEEP